MTTATGAVATTATATPTAGAPTGAAALADGVRFWGALVVGTAARAALLLVACLLLGAALPALWGWVPTTVASGSMAPRIGVGDVVVAVPVPADRLTVGQVLLVDDPSRPGDLLLHRLAAVEEGGMLRLRGDANAQADATLVPPDAVRGVGVLLVPSLGLPTTWQGGDRVVGAGLTALALLVLLGLARLAPRDDGTVDPRGVARHRAQEARPTSAPDAATGGVPRPGTTWWRGGAGRRGRLLRTSGGVLGVVAAVTVLFVVIGSSRAAFSATTAASGTWDTADRFSCLDAPPPDRARFSYRYDDPLGTTLRDATGNGRTGTLTGGTTLRDGSCRPGDSPYLRLDGAVGSGASTGEQIQGPTTFSVETWFRTTTTRGGKLIGFGNARTGGSTQYDRHLYLSNSGALVFGVYRNEYRTISSPAGFADGEWHLATATFDGAQGDDRPGTGMKLYVDGVLVASDPFDRAEPFRGWWRVGGDTINGAWPQWPTSGWLQGDLDETTVWDRVLDGATVADHHSAGLGDRSSR